MNLHHNHHNHPARCLDNRLAKLAKLLASAAAIFAAGSLSPALNADEVLIFDDSNNYWGGSLSTGNEGDTLELRATSSRSAWVSGNITGAGALRKTGSGELYLGGDGSFTGGLTILEGIISFDGDDMPLGALGGALTLDGGKLNSDFANIYAPLTLDPSRPVTLGANGGSLSGVLAINQTIAGSGALTINRHNANTTITLGGLQNYTGATTVDNADLIITGTHLNHGGLTITNGSQVNVGEPSYMDPDPQAQTRLEGDIYIRRGTLYYNGHSTAASGVITIGEGRPFDSPDYANAEVYFNDTSSAGDATINVSADGELWFMPAATFDSAATSGSATINNNGGVIYFRNYFDTSSAAHTTIINNAPATLDDDHPQGFIEIASTLARTFAIGHLSGSGDIYIGNNTLVIGGLDDRPMTISGGIFYSDYYGNIYGGIISGIEKTGDSTLTLTGSSHYYGPTAVTGGRLVLAAPDAIASSASDAFTRSALVTLSGNATIVIEADNALWNLTSASADTTIELAAATTTTLRNDRIEDPESVDPDDRATLSTGNTAYDGRIIGSGALRKTGDGALILNGANTYSGPTTIAAGVLQIGDATHSAASITSDITIDSDAALVGYGHIAGDITNNGELLFLAAATPGSGATITNNGALYFHNQSDAPSLTAAHTTIINDNPAGFIEINAITPDRTFAIGHLSGSGDTYIGNNTLVIGGLDNRPMTISGGIFHGDHTGAGGVLGGIEKTGDSTLTLSGSSIYYGSTAVTAGRLVLAAPDTIARSALVTLSGAATLAIEADNTLWNLTSASADTTIELAATTTTTLRNDRVAIVDNGNAGAPVFISDGDTAYDGSITGPGALRKTGPGALTLNGANTYSGPTTIAAGVLQIGDATHSAASITSDITIDSDAALVGYGHIAGDITNNGELLFLAAATPGSGATITNNGALYFHNQSDAPSLTAAHTTIINDAPAGFIEINAITPDRTFAIGHLSGSGDTYIGNNTLVIGGLDDRPMTISGGIFYGDHNGNGSAGVLGGIEKTGDSTLTLSGANTYYGPTAVTAGRLVLAAPDTIAHSALITLSGAATLAVTADNTLQNLTSASDAATLELAAATTTTLRNARVEIPDTDNASAPVIISTGNTAYDGRITGPGALRKTGDGALTLNGASTYSGPTTIAAGVLQIGDATHPAASITSDITIAAGATLAGYGRITGSITNNGIISLGDAFEPAATPAPSPAPIPYIALRAAAPGNPAAAPAPATGNYTIQGSLTNNNLLKLGRSGGTPGNTLTITGAYAGNGVIRLNTNLATGNTDHLIVRGNATGAVNLMIDTTSAASSNIRDDARLALVALPAATTAAITLVDTSWNPIDYIEAGMHTFQLTVVDGGVQLLSYDRQSHAADAILATASVAGAEWHYALDNLSKRLGDLRAETAGARTPESGAPGATRGSVWLRANTYRLNADTGISRASFHEYVSSINGGIDILRPTPRGALYLGGYFDIGHAGRTFDNHGDGSTSALGLGLYATLINPDGWYLDLIAKLERNKNEFNARATDGHITSGIYTTKNEILSVEFGRRLANAGGWWVEPGAQIAVAWLGGDSYTTTGATQIPVRISNAMAMQYRVQLRAGKHIDSSRWNPYVKFAAAKNDSDTASVTAWDKTYARDCDGWRAETGAGASYLIDASSQLYFDYEYAKAASYERPWSLTLGYRRVW